MTFEFLRVRFHFRALDSICFPAGKSGNVVRGAFGTIFRKLACVPECRDPAACEIRAECPYARIFEPRAAAGEGPSGLADWPRPFVFRAAHLDGCTVPPGADFYFDVHLFDFRDPAPAHFERAFAQLAREGLGPGRGRAELIESPGTPYAIDLGAAAPARRVTVRFLTPTELKAGNEPAPRPEFGVLFARLRDRISTLRALYGTGPLEIDFKSMGERAARVRMPRCALQTRKVVRRSSRTGQVHGLGGFTGEAEYEGDLGEFLPYLHAGRWTGIGRQTVWGKGEISVEITA